MLLLFFLRIILTPLCVIRDGGVFFGSELITVMRSLLSRCLVALLLVALTNGNAHAALHLGAPHTEPCPEGHAHHSGKSAPHHPQELWAIIAFLKKLPGMSEQDYAGLVAPNMTNGGHYGAKKDQTERPAPGGHDHH